MIPFDPKNPKETIAEAKEIIHLAYGYARTLSEIDLNIRTQRFVNGIDDALSSNTGMSFNYLHINPIHVYRALIERIITKGKTLDLSKLVMLNYGHAGDYGDTQLHNIDRIVDTLNTENISTSKLPTLRMQEHWYRETGDFIFTINHLKPELQVGHPMLYSGNHFTMSCDPVVFNMTAFPESEVLTFFKNLAIVYGSKAMGLSEMGSYFSIVVDDFDMSKIIRTAAPLIDSISNPFFYLCVGTSEDRDALVKGLPDMMILKKGIRAHEFIKTTKRLAKHNRKAS